MNLRPKEIKALEKEEENLRHELDKVLKSKANWARLERIVEINLLLEAECNQ